MKPKMLSTQLKKMLRIDEKELEPYYRYYLGELTYEDLSEMQQEKLERYRKIWSWYCMGRTKASILGGITRDYDTKIRQAEYDLSAAIAIHGKLDKVDQDGRRNASIELYDMISQLALKEKNFEASIKARKIADDFAGLNKDEEVGWSPEDFERPTKEVWQIVQINNNYYGGDNDKNIIEIDE